MSTTCIAVPGIVLLYHTTSACLQRSGHFNTEYLVRTSTRSMAVHLNDPATFSNVRVTKRVIQYQPRQDSVRWMDCASAWYCWRLCDEQGKAVVDKFVAGIDGDRASRAKWNGLAAELDAEVKLVKVRPRPRRRCGGGSWDLQV